MKNKIAGGGNRTFVAILGICAVSVVTILLGSAWALLALIPVAMIITMIPAADSGEDDEDDVMGI